MKEKRLVDVVITTGGTGITSRDSTFEAIDSLLEKRLEGFGKLKVCGKMQTGRQFARPSLL